MYLFMNLLIRPVKNIINNTVIRNFSHYHNINIEILHKKVKDLAYQQQLLIKNNIELKMEVEVLKKELNKMKANKCKK